jgi:hypothetical protein
VRWLSILGIAALSFLLGAAVMFFHLPSEGFLEDAFVGAKAWYERATATAPKRDGDAPAVTVAKGGKEDQAYDGLTLYTTDVGAQALLIDIHGDVVHKWEAPFRRVWPNPAKEHVRNPVADTAITFFGCHLFPNGDLLAVYHGQGDTPYGYGLAKVDKDSNVLWRYDANVHHDVDVGDDGTIYALTQKIVTETPKGLELLPKPCLIDYLVLLAPDGGKPLKTIPILEAFRDSPYSVLLASLERPPNSDLALGAQPPGGPLDQRRDLLHTNFVQVLTKEMAPHFPIFKPGQVLISVRQLDTIAVLDIDKGTVVWATQGPWRGQHSPQFLENGRILVFDNLGARRGSRVLEYDPVSHACPWSYTNDKRTAERGMCQRLPNGDTLFVNSDTGDILELNQNGEVVWSCSCHSHVGWARRYGPDEVRFLKGGERADR